MSATAPKPASQRGPGRPSVGATSSILVRLTDAQRAIAEQLGGGNANAGIRIALELAAERGASKVGD